MLRVGLTGGIGAGKSTAATRLAELGAVVIDADRLARQVVAPGTPGLAAVVAAFGTGVLGADGSLDRASLARIVFADPASLARLNGLTHPRIALRTAELMAAAPTDAVLVHDVPLLVENRMGARYHLVVVVHAAAQDRARRLVERRGLTSREAAARIAAQADDDVRRRAADVWLDNAGVPDDLLTGVTALWHERLVPFADNLGRDRAAGCPAVVRIADPDPTWPVQADRLAERVRAAAGPAGRVDHTGSTAVPGLAARDVLDLDLVLPDPAAAAAARPALQDVGFIAVDHREQDRGERSGRDDGAERGSTPGRTFATADPGRAATLRVWAGGETGWERRLQFRDWLRAHPDEAAGYAGTKRSSAGADLAAYRAGTQPWIGSALARAGSWAARTGWQPEPERRGPTTGG